MEKKRILVTGFEPFGGRDVNPSFEAVKLALPVEEADVKAVCLPVSWDKTIPALYSAIDEFDPHAVLMCGQASGSEHIRIERIGINIRGVIKDNDGNYPGGEAKESEICSDGPAAYFSTFDHLGILSAVRALGIPAAYSFSAGTYICNLVLYSALMHSKERKSDCKVGFIHVPDATEFSSGEKFSMPIEKIAAAVKAALVTLSKEDI